MTIQNEPDSTLKRSEYPNAEELNQGNPTAEELSEGRLTTEELNRGNPTAEELLKGTKSWQFHSEWC